MKVKTENDFILATDILREAVEDLRRETIQVGRTQLFEMLLPQLVAGATEPRADSSLVHSHAELCLAMLRLRKRLRERVNTRLRVAEPDARRRRALRQRLHTVLSVPEDRP